MPKCVENFVILHNNVISQNPAKVKGLCRMVTRNEDRGLGKVDFVTARTKGGIGCVWQKG